MENPYKATESSIDAIVLKPYDQSKVTLARLSWMLPLICLGISIAINVAAKPLGAIGGFIFMGGVLVGFILAVVALFMSMKYRGVLGHAIAGLIANVVFGIAIIGMFHAISLYRESLKNDHDRVHDHSSHRH